MTQVFETTQRDSRLSPIEMLINEVRPEFSVSIGMDSQYYYLKFFPNGIFRDILTEILDEFEQIEDFHYQNQTDPPEDVPYEEFQDRDKKWESLTGPVDNYTRMLSYDIFGMDHLRELITQNWYTGKKDMYEHLAYKFDNFNLVKEKDDGSVA